MSIITTLSDDKFKTIVQQSNSYADICRQLGLRKQGGYYKTIKRKIKKCNISTEHFLSLSELLSHSNNFNWINEETFIRNINSYCDDTLKKKIIEFNLIPQQCKECGLKNTWNNKHIVLQLDHIDGNHKNNKLENLRWLCPNCHSQTESFCGKNKKIKVCDYTCPECGNPKSKTGKICKSCSHIKCGFNRRKTNHPSKEELEKLIWEMPFIQISKKYGISDVAVKKWCKKYGITNIPGRGYWQKQIGRRGEF